MQLTYFDARGVAEVTHCMLKIAGVPFDDHRLSMAKKDGGGWDAPEFAALKLSGDASANMDRVPILTVDGVTIGQSKAIDRFVAKRCNMMGNNDIEAAQIDCITEHVRDIKDKYQKVKAAPESEKVAKLEEFFAVTLPALLVQLEKSLPSTRSAGFSVGNATSYADVAIFNFLTEYFDNNAPIVAALTHCAALNSIVTHVSNLPGLKSWMAERPSNPF